MRIEKLSPKDQMGMTQVAELHQTLLPVDIAAEELMSNHRAMTGREDYALLVAREDDVILGTVTAVCCQALTGRFMVLEDFVVRPGMTGKGIGSLLMEAADAFAAEQGCTYGILVSSGYRKDAHRFYERHGFEEDVRGFRKGY